MKKRKGNLLNKSLIIGLAVVFICFPVFGSTASLKDRARDLGQEKAQYQEKAEKAEKEAQSLAERVSLMAEQIKQIGREVKRTQKEMVKTTRLIDEIGPEIDQKERELIEQEEILAETICYLYEEGDQSIIDTLFSSVSFSDVIDRTEYLSSVEEKVEQTIAEIDTIKTDLEDRKSALEIHQEGLKELKVQLKVCQELIKEEKQKKKKLLAETEGEEDRYQRLVTAKEAEQREILKRIGKLEKTGRGKRYIGKPKKQPEPDKGGGEKPGPSKPAVFRWPLKKFVLTQRYGCTSFARCGNKNGPYGGKPHNGIDLSSRPNSNGFLDLRVRAVMSGKVIMVAPKQISGGWGNAVVIAHPNGLFTLYGHLSKAIVKEGKRVTKGQMIGIEGNTGFSTGRHLHFSVYMEIIIYKTSWYYGPGYNFEYTLNPLIFLPKR